MKLAKHRYQSQNVKISDKNIWVDPKKFSRVCMEFSKHNWATISETICPETLIFGK